jgi:hypothetical protein
MLEYGFRSACCKAPLRLGKVKMRSSRLQVRVWVCTKCRARDVNIISLEEARNQPEEREYPDV